MTQGKMMNKPGIMYDQINWDFYENPSVAFPARRQI
jgi:hypothetical protein